MSKLIVISDLHLHFWKAFSEGHGPHGSRFLRTLGVVRESLAKANELECPWICAGDWVHTIGWTHNSILTYLIELLNQFPKVQMFSIWGNHDARSHGGQITSSETVVAVLAEAVPQLTILPRPGSGKTKNGLKIFGQGYQPESKFLEIDRIQPNQWDVGVFHQTVSGSKLASGLQITNTVSGLNLKELQEKFRLTIVGDIHHPQAFVEGQRVVLVPGSPEHHNFGDVGDHGWWECELQEGGDVQCIQHPGGSPQFLTVESGKDVKDDGNYYRVLTPCDSEDLPRNAIVVASQPISIESRNLVKEGSSTKEILQAWLGVDPPDNPGEYLAVGETLLGEAGIVTVRPVRVTRVSLKGFMCFAEAQFDVERGVVLVVGEARDYESNGAGKTTLFEAIFWALFSRTTKGVSADDVIQWGSDVADVTVALYDDDHNQEIVVRRTRIRGGGAALSVSSGGEEWGGGVADLTKELGKYLGITPDLFQALAYFSQSRLVLFSQATDSDRKLMLSDLCGLGVFQAAAGAARQRATALENTLQVKEQELVGLRLRAELVRDHLKAAEAGRSEWKNHQEIAVAGLKIELGQLEKQFAEFDSQLTMELNQIDERFKAELRRVEGQQATRLKEREAEIKMEIEAVLDQHGREVQHYSPEAWANGSETWQRRLEDIKIVHGEVKMKESALSAQLLLASRAAAEATSLKDRCPVCGQEITAQFHTAHVNGLTLNVENLKTELGKVLEEVAKYTIQVNNVSQIRVMAVQVEHLTRDRDNKLNGLTRDLENAEQEVFTEVHEDLSAIHHRKALEEQGTRSKITAAKAQNTGRQETIKARFGEIAAEVDKFAVLIQQAQESIASQVLAESQTVAEIGESQREARVLVYWARGFSRSGVQSLLLEGVAAAFNQIRARIFPLLTRGIYDVQFSTTSETAEGEAREKTAFIIRDRDALVTYEALSGGQRRRIDLGVMLTLALAVSQTRRVPGVLGMLILDEVFGFLDSDGVEALYETLGEVQKTIPSIYSITHDPDLQSLFGHTLLVQQDSQGVSTLITQPVVGE